MICTWHVDRGFMPADAEDRNELVDMFDCLLDVGHTVEESCDFVTALAAGRVS